VGDELKVTNDSKVVKEIGFGKVSQITLFKLGISHAFSRLSLAQISCFSLSPLCLSV
jgi:hypothetical protein